MKKFNKTISKVLAVLLLVSTMVSLLPEPVHAANTKIRQEINILDGYLGSPSGSFATSSEIINIEPTKYSNATFYFEVVASTSATLSTQFFLRNATSGAPISTITIPTGTTAYTLFRSAAFTPQTGSTDYVAVVASTTGATKGLIAARVVVLQDASSLDLTQTQIEIGNNENYTSTATSSLASPKYWYYDSSKWSGTPTFYAEATYGRLIDTYVGSSTTYSTSGTRTQVIPSSVASTTIVELWGGGGGGGAASTNTTGSGSGGAGGQYSKKTIASLAGTSKTVVVGAFGPGGVSTAAGTAGGDSTWDTNVVVAKGGAGGGANSGTAGAGSTTGGVGDTVRAGGNGAAGASGGTSGGGGGGAGSTATGGNASGGTAGTGQSVGGGNGGTGQSTNGTPAAASNAGGGGAGGRSTGSPNVDGGAGGVGRATITFNLNQSATTTIVLQEDDGSFANWTDKVYIVTEGTASSSSRVRSSAFTPTSGRNYRIAVKEGYNGATHQIYNAKIIADQTTAGSFDQSTYDSKSYTVSAQETSTHSVDFSADGTKMYITGRSGSGTVYQYSLSTAWDVSSASYVQSKALGNDGTMADVFFKSDGTKMYASGRGNSSVYQYSLSSAWDISTASYDSVSFSYGSQATAGWSIFLSSDGSKMYIGDDTTNKIFQYTLSTPWDLSTASYASKSLDITSQDGTPAGIFFKSDGLTLYAGGNGNDKIYEYTLSSAWDISTASYNSVFYSVASQNTDLHNIAFSTDYSKFYAVHNVNDTVYQYSNPASSAITLLEAQYQIANTKLSSGTSLQNFRTYFDSAEWNTTNTYIHEANSVSAGTSDAKLQERTGSTDLSGSTITDIIQREQSSSVTMPSTARDIDVIATTNNNDIYSSRILVQVDARTAPTLSTDSVSSITTTTATLNGTISSIGGSSATVRGFAYGTNSTLATVISTTTENGTFSAGAYTYSASSLTCNTTYYVRAYATNSVGTGYGSIANFTTSACPTTTLGDGTDGSNSTIAPGASATEIDRFSLVTSAGSDTVTGLTVQVLPSIATTTIATVGVYNTSNSLLCSATPSGSNSVALTSCGISVSTTPTDYVIKITPKSHANMPAVPGASYAVTATTTSITASNATTGTDTDSATITVENASPGDVTSPTATAGDTLVSFSWTNPGDSDLSKIMVIASTSAITFTPTEGATYSTSTLNGASRVACYGLQTSCSDTSLSNGTAYYYKIFTLDSNGNWSAGVTPTGSPATPFAAPQVTESHYRWRNRIGSESGAGYAEAEDNPLSSNIEMGDSIRLRFLIYNTSGDATGYNYRLEQASSSCTTYIQVPNTSSGNSHWIMETNHFVSDSTATTNSGSLSNPLGSFVSGYVMTQSNQTPALSLTSGQYTHIEYSIRSTSYLSIGTNYCFRLTNAGSTTGFSYDQIAQITVPQAVIKKSGGGGNSVEGSGTGTIIPGGNAGGGGGSTGGSGGGQGQTGGGSGGGGGGDTGLILINRFLATIFKTYNLTIDKFTLGYILKLR